MKTFYKQLIGILIGLAVITTGVLVIRGATPGGNVKVNPILGHDLDLDAKYYGQAANNTVHDITTEDISISAWVKVDVGAETGYIISKFSNSPGYYFINYGSYFLFAITDGNDAYTVRYTYTLGDNKWHHITAVIDRDNTANCKMFMDGIDVTSLRTGTIGNVDSITTIKRFTIGARDAGDFNHNGQIRDVKLYYAEGDHWSDAQVLYQAQHPFDYTANAGTLTDYWRLDEGTGTTLYGKPSTGYNLTLSNVLAWTTQPKIKMVGCPPGYIRVPGNATYGTSDFCVMQYEAKNVGGVAVSQAGTTPWASITQTAAITACTASGGHLITNNEWMTIARNAEQVDTNWSGGSVGSGGMYRGNVGNDDTLGYNGSDPEYGTGRDSKASLTLSNGQVIWDLSGNVWEWTNNTIACAASQCTTDEMPYDATPASQWIEFNTINTYGQLSYDEIRPSNATWTATQGMGRLYTDYDAASPSGNTHAFLRGGSWGDTTNAGAFTLHLNHAPANSNNFIGFRCVRSLFNTTATVQPLPVIKVSTGLVGWWKMDDNADNTTVRDYSRYANTGTFTDTTGNPFTSAHTTTTAQIGRAMTFDGVDDWVDVGNGASINSTIGTGDFTYSAWVKLIASPGGVIAHKSITPSVLGFTLSHQISNYNPSIQVYFVGSDANYAANYRFTIDSVWHYIALSVPRSSTKVNFYIDGVLQTDLRDSTNLASIGSLANSGSFKIGAASSVLRLNGSIDDVKIWNYARTAEQIKQDYERGIGGLPY